MPFEEFNRAAKIGNPIRIITMEPYWVQKKIEIPEPLLESNKLVTYIQNCMENKGAVTINLCIYQDGTVGKQALQFMKEVESKFGAHIKE